MDFMEGHLRMTVTTSLMLLVVFAAQTALTVPESADHPRTSPRPIDCEDIRSNISGIYAIFPEKTEGIEVRNDKETGGRGWTIIQRRVSVSDFYKNWQAYEIGFGDLDDDGNFWLGNLQTSLITSQSWYQLRVDMVHSNGTSAFAEYKKFEFGDKATNNRLWVNGYSGNAGDSLLRHDGREFQTYDRDPNICAKNYKGAWWYAECHSSNLNGVYGEKAYGQGISWGSFTGHYSSLTKVEMKIKRQRPRSSRLLLVGN